MLLMLSIVSCSSPNKNPLIVGHRGAMGHVTENTIPSIKKAVELGVDGIEIDVFKCKSGEIIVFHDKKLDRLTNSSGYIEDLSYDSINKIKVMGEYRIPELIEVINILPNEIFLNIELKGEETAKKVNEIITKFINKTESKLDRFIISSFNWNELENFRSFNSKIPIAILTDTNPLNAIPVAKKLNAVAINPNYKLLDKNVVNQSLAQVDNAIKTCVELGSNYYSFHAGFLCDLEVSELGKPIKKRKINDRKICTEVFIERVKQISKKAENKNVNIMIENNVLSFNNKKQFEGNPLLMCDTQECITIVKELPKNVKLLIDLAHLKVSANSLNFDPIEMIEKCKPYTGGYHLSDNDGTKDSNRPFNKYSWFWDYIKKDLDYYSIEVYDIKMSEMIELRNILNSKLK